MNTKKQKVLLAELTPTPLEAALINLGSCKERVAIFSYLQDVLRNTQTVDSVTLTVESVLNTIMLEIDEGVHHEASTPL